MEWIPSDANGDQVVNVMDIITLVIQSIQFDFAKYGTRKQQEHLKDVLQYVANNIGTKVKYANNSKSVHSNLLKDAFI